MARRCRSTASRSAQEADPTELPTRAGTGTGAGASSESEARMTVSSARSFVAAALAGLVLAGCGGDEPEPSAREPGPGEPPAAAASRGDAETADTPNRGHAGRPDEMGQAGTSSAPDEASPAGRRQDPPATAESDDAKPNAAARRLLQALAPSRNDTGGTPSPADPASRKLWALVQRRVGRSGAVAAPEQAPPSPEALRRLVLEAQRQGG